MHAMRDACYITVCTKMRLCAVLSSAQRLKARRDYNVDAGKPLNNVDRIIKED